MAMKVYTSPRRVGLRAFRAQLRRWLDEVRAGNEIVLTDRGSPVARIVPPDQTTARLEELTRAGVVARARKPKRSSSKHSRVRLPGDLTAYVLDDRDR